MRSFIKKILPKDIKFIMMILIIGMFMVPMVMFKPANLTATPTLYQDIPDYDEKPVSLSVDQGTLVKISVPASAVFVADPTVADVQVKTPKLLYIYGRSPGTTNLYAVDENENVLMNRTVNIAFETSRLQKAINSMLPNANIRVEGLNNTIVLRGSVHNAADAADAVSFAERFIGEDSTVVNQMSITGSNQINLQVTIAEMSKNTMKDLGINWDLSSAAGNFIFGLATGAPTAVGNAFLSRANGANSLGVGYRGGSTSVSSLINALEEEGLIKVMAKPNLTALSGETASFLAGGEFPVPVAQEDDRISIEFREYGVSLAFTPTLSGDNRISLRVRPEVSQLTNTGAFQDGTLVVPALSTRRAETTVEMGSGQSFAIAGLMQQRMIQDEDSVPGVNEVPGLSALFQNNSFQSEETELVIIVTPYVVRPTNGKLKTPYEGFTPPSDSERYLQRAMYKRPEKKPKRHTGFELN